MGSGMFHLVKRELWLSFRRGAQPLSAVFFSLVVASLFPFVFGNNPAMLASSAAGIAWVSALLASLLTLEPLYQRDQDDGTYDLLLLSPLSPLDIIAAKTAAHALLSGLPLTLSGAIAALMLRMPSHALPELITSLILGLAYMSLLGGMGAVLSLNARRPGLLLALIVFPLYVPMLIFGVSAALAGVAELPARPYLLLQLALILAGLPLTLMVSALAFRLHVRS